MPPYLLHHDRPEGAPIAVNFPSEVINNNKVKILKVNQPKDENSAQDQTTSPTNTTVTTLITSTITSSAINATSTFTTTYLTTYTTLVGYAHARKDLFKVGLMLLACAAGVIVLL